MRMDDILVSFFKFVDHALFLIGRDLELRDNTKNSCEPGYLITNYTNHGAEPRFIASSLCHAITHNASW